MVKYQNVLLMKNSTAYELYELWQKSSGENKNAAKKKLDYHMQGVNLAHDKLHGVMPEHLLNYRVGDHPEDWK